MYKLVILSMVVLIFTGCARHQSFAHLSLGIETKYTDKVSDSSTFKATGLAITAGSRAISGALPKNAGIGISAILLLSSMRANINTVAGKNDHLEVWMPLNIARDEEDAQIKMGEILEKAIRNAFVVPYKTQVVETWRFSLFGKYTNRDILVDGPQCEHWSCIVKAPLPTKTAELWDGKMLKIHEPLLFGENNPERYAYKMYGYINFGKIVAEIRKDNFYFIDSRQHNHFDDENLLLQISKNLPDWAYYYRAPHSKNNSLQEHAALFNKGKIIFLDTN